MRVATFNANSIRSRLPIVLQWLRDNQPDLLCLQETKTVDAHFPSLTFTEAGFHAVFCGEKSYNGVAMISRTPIARYTFGLDDGDAPDSTRFAYAQVGGIHVVNTYVPQGRELDHAMYQYKLRWFQRLRRYFERHFTTSQKVLWLGDLNVAPEPMDVHNPQDQANHVCFHEAVRRAFAETVAWGFHDVFRKHHPEPGLFSFFDYRTIHAVQKKMGWRVDHLLATPPLAKLSSAAWIDMKPRLMDKPSDHTFVVADFDV